MARPAYEAWAREILRCPVGLHPLLDVLDDSGQVIGLECDQDCGAPGQRRRYPVADGIPVLLVDDAIVVSAGD